MHIEQQMMRLQQGLSVIIRLHSIAHKDPSIFESRQFAQSIIAL
jgi:hypothetical protein